MLDEVQSGDRQHRQEEDEDRAGRHGELHEHALHETSSLPDFEGDVEGSHDRAGTLAGAVEGDADGEQEGEAGLGVGAGRHALELIADDRRGVLRHHARQ
jgi:hypothetical protein